MLYRSINLPNLLRISAFLVQSQAHHLASDSATSSIHSHCQSNPHCNHHSMSYPTKPHPRGYVAYRVEGGLPINGKLDHPAWQAAPWSEEFIDIEGPDKVCNSPISMSGHAMPCPCKHARHGEQQCRPSYYTGSHMHDIHAGHASHMQAHVSMCQSMWTWASKPQSCCMECAACMSHAGM